MRVALAQINPTSADLSGNTARIVSAIRAAADEHADVVVTPELALPGYCIGDLVEDADFLAANERALQDIAAAARGIAAVVGFIDVDSTKVNDHGTVRKYNAAAVVRDGRVLHRARKSLLPSYRYFDDKRFFSPGERRDPVQLGPDGSSSIGVSICEDLWDDYYDIKPLPELAAKGAGLILNLNASPFYPGKRRTRERLIKAHIQRLGRPIVYVNTVGAADNGKNIIPFDGESLVYDGAGRLIALGAQFKEDLLVVDLDGRAGQAALDLPADDPVREMYDALVMALGDYMRKIGFTRAVIAVSGGIDSALALAIAVDALGPGRVTTFNLPSKHNTDRTRSIAERLATAFGVRDTVVPIQQIDDEMRAVFERHAHPITQNLTRENLHARIRGVLMMAESNDTGALLISCGNETEIALGYATLYGDMCGGISLIGDLSKTDVYNLSRYVNRRHGREMIPEETFTLKPSAELAEGQFDPFDYSVVAPIVGEFVERRTTPKDLIRQFGRRTLDPVRFKADAEGKSPYDKYSADAFAAIVQDAYRRMRRSVYKRLQGPPIVVVSERAFGFDLRETIINQWEG